MEIKAGGVDAYLAKPDARHRVFLIYGPDRGLVSERAKVLIGKVGVDTSDPFSTIRLQADDAASDPQRVADEAHTVSMFGGNRLIWITGTTQKHLVNAIKPILDVPPTDAVVVIEAADLKKTAPLRKAIEKAPSAAALPCYQDQAAALQRMVDGELKSFGLSIEPNARTALLANLGDDRMASRNEVQKVCLFAMNAGSITESDIIELVGDAAAISADAIVDAASLGQLDVVERDLRRLLDREASSFSLLNAAHRHFQTLHLLATRASAQRVAARSLVSSMRPPVIYSRRNHVERALDSWTTAGLLHVTKRLDQAVLESRANDALAGEIVTQTFLFISSEARRQAKQR